MIELKKSLPKCEIRRATYDFEKGKYIITSKNDVFYLYRIENGVPKKAAKASTPKLLETMIYEEIGK